MKYGDILILKSDVTYSQVYDFYFFLMDRPENEEIIVEFNDNTFRYLKYISYEKLKECLTLDSYEKIVKEEIIKLNKKISNYEKLPNQKLMFKYIHLKEEINIMKGRLDSYNKKRLPIILKTIQQKEKGLRRIGKRLYHYKQHHPNINLDKITIQDYALSYFKSELNRQENCLKKIEKYKIK